MGNGLKKSTHKKLIDDERLIDITQKIVNLLNDENLNDLEAEYIISQFGKYLKRNSRLVELDSMLKKMKLNLKENKMDSKMVA